MDLIQKPIYKYKFSSHVPMYLKVEHQFIQYCFDILYHLCSVDMNESFLINLFELLIDNQLIDQFDENSNLKSLFQSLKMVKQTPYFFKLKFFF